MSAGLSRSTVATSATSQSSATAVDLALTPDLLKHYIAVKKDLNPFWQSHQDLLKKAQSTAHQPVVSVTDPVSMKVTIAVFDYVNLAAQEPALAAIFKKDGLQPAQFEPTQVSVMKALYTRAALKAMSASLKDPSSVNAKNVALVEANLQDLSTVVPIPKMNVNRGSGGSD